MGFLTRLWGPSEEPKAREIDVRCGKDFRKAGAGIDLAGSAAVRRPDPTLPYTQTFDRFIDTFVDVAHARGPVGPPPTGPPKPPGPFK